MRDRLPEENPNVDTALLSADEYERRATVYSKPKGAATVRTFVIAACLLAAGGAIAFTSANKDVAAEQPNQQFAAADAKQVEPQQMKVDPTAPPPAPEATKAPAPEKLAKAETPRVPRNTSAPAPAPKPIEAPAAAVSPPAAATIPEVAPAPADIAPEAAPPPAATPSAPATP